MCQAGRDVIISHRRVHLEQQAAERRQMDEIIEECKRTGRGSQPSVLFIEPDGKTLTPVMRTGDSAR
jgi:hypothetical protein